MKLYVEKFVPLQYKKYNLEDINLFQLTGKKWEYSSSGKVSLYHCLKSLDVKGKLLLPIYMCGSIKPILKRLNIIPIYYDINETDLNASVNDIRRKIEIHSDISCVLVASLYGNPANLKEIEYICKSFNIKLIDDAAQSFGARLGEQFVGTFGDAGFFSFSPGKSTPGHLGSFYWTSNSNYTFKRKNHYMLHMLAYATYNFTRYKIYKYKKYKVFNALSFLNFYFQKKIDMVFDKMNQFENEILGGVLYANLNQTFRTDFSKQISQKLEQSKKFRLITKGEDGSNNHKIVLIAKTENIANEIVILLLNKGVYISLGYDLMDYSVQGLCAGSIYKRVVEIPLEDDIVKLEYIINLLRLYEYSSNNNHIQ